MDNEKNKKDEITPYTPIKILDHFFIPEYNTIGIVTNDGEFRIKLDSSKNYYTKKDILHELEIGGYNSKYKEKINILINSVEKWCNKQWYNKIFKKEKDPLV